MWIFATDHGDDICLRKGEVEARRVPWIGSEGINGLRFCEAQNNSSKDNKQGNWEEVTVRRLIWRVLGDGVSMMKNLGCY